MGASSLLVEEDGWCTNLSSALACVTFKLSGKLEQSIFGDNHRGVAATGEVIYIYGVDNESNRISIPYHTPSHTWNTVLVEWLPDKGQQGRYIINNLERKHFKCNQQSVSSNIDLGGRDKPMKGSIATFEVYFHWNEMVPNDIINLIMEDQQI